MIRRKVKKKRDEKTSQSNEKKNKKPPTPQWTYIKNCTHNIQDKSCPLCKLIIKETEKWLWDEIQEKNLRKRENFYKRAEMRYCLLREWSKNQLSLYSDVMIVPLGEIVLTSSLFDVLSSSSNPEDEGENDIIQNLTLNLTKRNRILEVGQYAATYIQCRIRGLCCRKRITGFMLRRFEYHEESARRGAYFLDKNNGNRYYSTPYLIRHEKPGSPRTIQRRITFQTKIREKRMEKYQELSRNPDYSKEHDGGQWKSIEKEIVLARQLVVLRDLIYCLFMELSMKRRDLGERPSAPPPTTTSSSLPLSLSSTKMSDTDLPNEIPTPDSFPFWFSVSNPAPPARQLYLSLALETNPLEKEEEIIATEIQLQSVEEEQETQTNSKSSKLSSRRVQINPMATVSSDKGEDENVQIPVIPVFNINERLQQLDLRIWEMMRCHTADEMVAKIIQCEEIQPTLSSCQQIAEDEHQIWKNIIPEDKKSEEKDGIVERNGNQSPGKMDTEEDIRDLAVMGQYRRSLSSKSTSRLDSKRGFSFDETDEEEKKPPSSFVATLPPTNRALVHGMYLPCQLHIHPFYPNRSPSGVIRLFFVDGVISAISHSSPWVYYPEIWKNKAAIIRSICDYSESKPVKSLLRALMNRANDLPTPSASSATTTTNSTSQPTPISSLSRPRGMPLPPTTPKPPDVNSLPNSSSSSSPPSNVISVVLPDEKTLFGNYPALTTCTLTGSEYRSVDQKYRFLRKMKAWKDARRYTASDRKPPVSEDNQPPSSSLSTSSLSSKLTQFPASEKLLGSTAYRLSCAEAPRESLSDLTKYHLASLGGGVAYRSLLKRAVNEVDTTLETKISPPIGNEFTKNVETPIPPPPPRNLIVIDVHVTIPPDEPAAHSNQNPNKSERRTSRLQSNAGISLSKAQSKAPKFTVDTHQVVGIFSTATDKCPSSLDPSLFTWQQLLKISIKFAALREIMKIPQNGLHSEEHDLTSHGVESHPSLSNPLTPLPSINSSRQSTARSTSVPSSASGGVVDMGATHTIKFTTPLLDESLNWSVVTPESGVYSTKVSLGGGLDLQVRFVGKPPEREYLEKTIPKKIRKWIGLKY